jgi:hypothetical protein
MECKLLPSQGPALEFLRKTLKAALFMATGTGKTLVTLLRLKELNKPSLIVVEASKKHIWIDENKKFEIGLNISIDWRAPGQFCVISYDWLKENAEFMDDFEVIVFDEAHCISDPNTLRYKNLIEKIQAKQYVILLSGYPVENHLQEIFVISLISNVLGNNYYHFLNKFFYVVRRGGHIVFVKPKPDSFDRIINLIKDIAFAVDKSNVMPKGIKKETIITRFKLSDEQRDIILSLFQGGEYQSDGINIHCKNGLVAYQKAIQLISGFVYNVNDKEELYPIPLKSNPKLELAQKLLKDKENFLLWYLFDYEQVMLNQFKNQARLCRLQTDSRGLNLQSYKFSVYFTLPLSGGQFLQGVDRLYRYGRTTDVLSVILLPEGEFGDRLAEMVNRKQRLTDKFLSSLLRCKV